MRARYFTRTWYQFGPRSGERPAVDETFVRRTQTAILPSAAGTEELFTTSFAQPPELSHGTRIQGLELETGRVLPEGVSKLVQTLLV